MLQLLAPWFLPALSALGVPVLLHLLHRRKRRLIRWGAMQFLMPDKKSQRRASLRVKDWMLLLLRMFCIAAVVLFFMRPQLPLGLANIQPRDVVLVLDTSLSTQQMVEQRSAWALMQAKAQATVAALRSDDTLRILLAGDTPTWLTPSALAGNAAGRQQAAELLAATESGLGVCRWPASLTEAVLARAPRAGMLREVVVITDGQAFGVDAENTATWTALRDVAQSPEMPCRIAVLATGPQTMPANLAVTQLEASREHAGAGETVLLRARVKNFSERISATAGLRWVRGPESVGVGTVPTLQPGQETTVEFSYAVVSTPGVNEVSCELDVARGDSLAADNRASVLIETLEAVDVLVVDGSQRVEPKLSDSAWIAAALAGEDEDAKAANATAFKTQTLSWLDFIKANLDKPKAIVLANPRPLQPTLIKKLEAFVRNGGGLWIMLGDQSENDADAANIAFADGLGLSPLMWTTATGEAGNESSAIALRTLTAEHPVTRLLADVKRSDLDRVRVMRRFEFGADLGQGTEVLLRSADGAPFLAEKTFGAGRVLVQAAPFNFHWSTWPKHQSFVVLLHEGLWRIASTGLTRRNLHVGELLSWPMRNEASASVPTLRLPDDSKVSARIETLPTGQVVAHFTDTARPGHYTLEGNGVDSRLAQWSVARDAAESNLTPLTNAQREALAQAAGLSFVDQPLAADAALTAQRSMVDITAFCAGFAVLCMVLESTLATFLLRRRHRAMQAAAPSVERRTA